MKRALSTLLVTVALLVPVPAGASSPPPDIVVVMADDLGAIDERLLSRLPNIKSLWLDGGLRFDSAYSETPLCCPGRASFLTGQHTRKHGVTRNEASLLDPRYTIATALQGHGYTTIAAGKYLNNMQNLTVGQRHPVGWDQAALLHDWVGTTSSTWYVNGRTVTKPVYRDRFTSDKSLAWLQRAPAGPVFMWLSPHAPHFAKGERLSPWVVDVEARYATDTRCSGIAPWKPPTYRSSSKPNGFPLIKACRSLLTVDDMVGRLRTEFARQGRTNVVWVLTADNGMSWGRDGFALKNVPQAGRLPLYVAGPGIGRGSTNALVSSIDLAPTLVHLAGTTMPRADGHSFANVLYGAPTFRESMIEDHPLGGYTGATPSSTGPWRGVRTPEWHLVDWPRWRGVALYRASDTWEQYNVAAQHPDVVAELRALLP